MKIFNLTLVSLGLLLVGCANKQPREPQSSKIHVVEKYITVGCPIPEYTCEFKDDVVDKLIDCISKQKVIIDNCRTVGEEVNKDNEE